MAKSSIGKDLMKITYKIKPKGMSKPAEEEPEEESEGGDPSEMLRQAATMIEEGNVDEAYDVIDEAVSLCREMHGGEEEDYD